MNRTIRKTMIVCICLEAVLVYVLVAGFGIVLREPRFAVIVLAPMIITGAFMVKLVRAQLKMNREKLERKN